MDALLNAIYLGDVGDSGVFRIDLSASGLFVIQSIIIEDDGKISGGTGAASGFDLDVIKLSSTLTSSPSQVASLVGLSTFTFSDVGVAFKPGFLQPYSSSDPSIANQNRLFGTAGSNIDFSLATLNALDGDDWTGNTSVSLGEGGLVGFRLNTPTSPSGLYLYVADVGGGNDGFRVRVSDAPLSFLPGLTLNGTSGDDLIDLFQGVNEPIGRGDDTINGGDGNDTIFSGAGNDLVGGDAGNDILNGGLGNDIVTGGSGSDQLIGDRGDDILNGGNDNDKINGGAGRDRVNAGLGDDRITLGKGKDIFEVTSGIGVDKITDFRDRQDRIDLPLGIKFRKLDIDQRGRNTIFSVDRDPLAILVNVQATLLTAADFI